MEYLDGLNEKQKEAALSIHGPLLIVAGAGAGKTKTITHRIVHLIKEGVLPNQILAITFTNKAAKEMRERVISVLPKGITEVPFVATFHALAATILREHAKLFNLTRYFTILDDGDTISLIKESIKELGLDPKAQEPRKFRYVISKAKGEGETQEQFATKASNYSEELINSVWQKYEEKKKKEGSVDFDDLLLYALIALRNQTIRDEYQSRWRYIHIDEYQDTNTVQYELAKLLVGSDHHICVVGDMDQNIYSWRGANMKNMLRFEKDYPEAKIVFLEHNYRSTKVILDAANAIIKKNTVRIPKLLLHTGKDGDSIKLYTAFGENDEAGFVADTADNFIREGTAPKDIAVLYRANFQSRVLEEAMLGANIPYQVVGTKFFERKEIKDMLAYVRAAHNRNSLSDIKRIINFPTRGIGKVTLVKLFAGELEALPKPMQVKINAFYELLDRINECKKTMLPSEVFKYILHEAKIDETLRAGGADDEDRLMNLEELVTLATKYDAWGIDEGMDKLLTDAALASDQDNLEEDRGGVRLMTVHAAKGLEFKVVFHEQKSRYKYAAKQGNVKLIWNPFNGRFNDPDMELPKTYTPTPVSAEPDEEYVFDDDTF
jgi:DNA helicase-2/ATP-dependent DNA helicase PcrA